MLINLNSYYVNFFLFIFVSLINQFYVMNKRNYFLYLSVGNLVKVSCFRFYLRKWFHFPIKHYRLFAISNFSGCGPDDLVLVWLSVFSAPNLKL